jgi:hypothetical protein
VSPAQQREPQVGILFHVSHDDTSRWRWSQERGSKPEALTTSVESSGQSGS